jgi:hypothetical protein
MKTHLEFTSTAFPAYPGEDKDINPGIFGKRLAEFLAEGLRKKGLQAILRDGHFKGRSTLNALFASQQLSNLALSY